jgi:translation machinery-associated protein 16
MPPRAAATKKGGKPPKKEKLFHPQSRKADQLVRAQHRKSKLQDLAKARSKKQEAQGEQCASFVCVDVGYMFYTVDLYNFFYAAIPTEGVLTLQDLHTIIQDVWLTRYDGELEVERAQRRKGRPKSTKEQRIEELKLRESEEYRAGLGAFSLLRSHSSHS